MIGYNNDALNPSRQMSKQARKEKLTRMTSYSSSPKDDDIRPLPLADQHHGDGRTTGHVFTENEKQYLSDEWKKKYP